MLPMSMTWSSSGMLTIGRIAYRREGDVSAQRGRGVIYYCLVLLQTYVCQRWANANSKRNSYFS